MGKEIVIKNSTGNSLMLNQKIVDAVWLRYQSLSKPNRYKAGQYVAPLWKDCPDIVFCPLIARLLAYLV